MPNVKRLRGARAPLKSVFFQPQRGRKRGYSPHATLSVLSQRSAVSIQPRAQTPETVALDSVGRDHKADRESLIWAAKVGQDQPRVSVMRE
jgi:hypothetical protein